MRRCVSVCSCRCAVCGAPVFYPGDRVPSCPLFSKGVLRDVFCIPALHRYWVQNTSRIQNEEVKSPLLNVITHIRRRSLPISLHCLGLRACYSLSCSALSLSIFLRRGGVKRVRTCAGLCMCDPTHTRASVCMCSYRMRNAGAVPLRMRWLVLCGAQAAG